MGDCHVLIASGRRRIIAVNLLYHEATVIRETVISDLAGLKRDSTKGLDRVSVKL